MTRTVSGIALSVGWAVLGAVAALWACICATGILGTDKRRVWRERLGLWHLDSAVGEGAVWLHAASVGEIAAARPLLRALRVRLPSRPLIVTCNTTTGRRAAEALDCDLVRYFPIDFGPIVKRVVRLIRPSLFIFVETEVWPTLLRVLHDSEIATAMVNARVSDRSFPGYRRIAALLRPVLGGIDVICARDEISRSRLVELGATGATATLIGDMKLDALAPSVVADAPDLLTELVGGLSAVAPVFVAASTRSGENELVLDAFERVLERSGAARLILAPRHPDRFDEVAALLADRGHAFVRRSAGAASPDQWQVLLLDTVGELRSCFKGATAAFVGGSLVPVGGHNVLEPAAFGVPVVVGPHLDDVHQQAVALADAGALRVIHDARELADVWSAWIAEPEAARAAGRRGAETVAAGRGAVQEAMERLEPLLVRRTGTRSR